MTPRREQSPEPADYALLNAVYGVALGALAARAQRARWGQEAIREVELLPLGGATFALSKVIAREKIGSWVREPFVDESREDRPPRGGRLRQAVGELLTCTRCVGAWSALCVVGLRLAAPPAGRCVAAVLAASALNDFLQAAFKLLSESTNQTAEVRQALESADRTAVAGKHGSEGVPRT